MTVDDVDMICRICVRYFGPLMCPVVVLEDGP